MPNPISVAILISGRGSNMEALIKASQAHNSLAKIVCVISNRPNVQGLSIAESYGIPAIAIDHKAYATRQAFENDIDDTLRLYKVELICAAGFMRILTSWFTKRWEDNHINIHPSLLPKYKGLNTHQRAIAAGDTVAGASVHYISAELDSGTLIDQMQVPVFETDTIETLSQRVRKIEHSLYPRVLMKLCTERVAARHS